VVHQDHSYKRRPLDSGMFDPSARCIDIDTYMLLLCIDPMYMYCIIGQGLTPGGRSVSG
jgi:hypothetical protein